MGVRDAYWGKKGLLIVQMTGFFVISTGWKSVENKIPFACCGKATSPHNDSGGWNRPVRRICGKFKLQHLTKCHSASVPVPRYHLKSWFRSVDFHLRSVNTNLAGNCNQPVMLTRTGHARTRTKPTRTRTWLTRRTRTSLTVTYCKLQLNLQSLSSNNNEHKVKIHNIWL